MLCDFIPQCASQAERCNKRTLQSASILVSGFGQTGPYAALPGFGALIEAMASLAARTGFPDREPVLPPLALADCITGLYGAFAPSWP